MGQESNKLTGRGDGKIRPLSQRKPSKAIRLIEQAARPFATKPAVIAGSHSYCYSELISRINTLASWLSNALPEGARVIICSQNLRETAVVPLALEACGLVRVPINWRTSPLELENMILTCRASMVIHDKDTEATVRQATDNLRQNKSDLSCAMVGVDALAEIPTIEQQAVKSLELADENNLASISFTSGTFSKPKGVMLSHSNWACVHRNLLSVRDFDVTDVIALMGPLSHASGAYLVPCLLTGSTIVLPQKTAADPLADEIERHNITVLQCVPTLLTRLIASERFRNVARKHLRLIIYGAESIPFSTLDAAIDAFGPILAQNYGLTEAAMTCATLPAVEHVADDGGQRRIRHGIIGRPYPFVEIAIRADDGSEVDSGEIGEITIRSPHVMLGYWDNPTATAAVLRDGWLWSGDLGRWTSDGYIELVGRSKDMIICGGMNIYPGEVQAYLSRQKGVREAAAFGISDDAWGELLVAAIVLQDDTASNREELQLQARHDLGIRTPKSWMYLDELPRTNNSKFDMNGLRALAKEDKLD